VSGLEWFAQGRIMKCERCKKNEAVIHFTQTVDGEIVSYNLCRECAEKQGLKGLQYDTEQQPAFSPEEKNQVLSELAGHDSKLEEESRCPFCGSTLEDIKKTGRLGCGRCYFVFEKQVDMLLRRIQGSSFHVGKRTGKPVSPAYSNQLKVRDLKKRLSEAVKVENFEEAARLRDEIITLEKRLEHTK
jgi:protein arginine kinase activator